MKYYLYRHIRLDKNRPFYIGIGTKRDRAFRKIETEYHRAYEKRKRNALWKNIVKKSKYEVEILFESNDYEEIREKEKEFISLYGRVKFEDKGILVNLTEGGEQPPYNDFSEETRRKMSKSSDIERIRKQNSKKCFHIKTGKEFNSLKEGCKFFNINYGTQKMAIRLKRTTSKFMFIGEEFTPIKRKHLKARRCKHLESGKEFISLSQGCRFYGFKYSQQQEALKLNLTTKKFKYINEV